MQCRPNILCNVSFFLLLKKSILLHFYCLVNDFMDPLQFACRLKRSLDDAILRVLSNIYVYLINRPHKYVKLF